MLCLQKLAVAIEIIHMSMAVACLCRIADDINYDAVHFRLLRKEYKYLTFFMKTVY